MKQEAKSYLPLISSLLIVWSFHPVFWNSRFPSCLVLPPDSVQLFADSIEGCQFDRSSLHHRVWNENPPELRWKRHVIAVCESDLEAEVMNQIENWKEQIPAVVLVVLPDIDGCRDISLSTVMNSTTDTNIVDKAQEAGEEEGEYPLHVTKSKEGKMMKLMTMMSNHDDDDDDDDDDEEQDGNKRAKVLDGYKALCECVRLEGGWVWSQKVFPVQKMKSLEEVGIT